MAFTRDLGIQFPSDATQASPSSTLAARRGYRYLSRGSRYGGQLGKLSGFEYPLGITFFKNLLPRSDLGAPEPVDYARFIDLRKTKVVDSVKEAIFGTQFRSSLDTELLIDDTEGFAKQESRELRTFPAKLLGGGGFEGDVFLSDWHEVVWDNSLGAWIQRDGGQTSIGGGLAAQAFHRPSSGLLTFAGISIVDMTLARTIDGDIRASFATINTTGTLFHAVITSVSVLGPTPVYDAQALPESQFPGINVTNQLPDNRLIVPIEIIPAQIGEFCIIVQGGLNDFKLWIMTETVGTVNCPGALTFQGPIDDPGARVSTVNYVHNPSAEGAIGQAI